jgi:tripartite-type tricarboxylate transporter receptor subunit TctC
MRMIVAAIAAMGIAVGLAANAQAQSFPSRPVSVIVTYPPGGPVDTVTRIVAEHMRGTLGQPFVVENVGGAGGSLGVGRLARSAANGYTLGVGDIGAFVLNGAVYALPYDLMADFEPIALLATSPLLVLARNTMPAKDLKELVAWLKDNRLWHAVASVRALHASDSGCVVDVRSLSRRRGRVAGPDGRADRPDLRGAGRRRAAVGTGRADQSLCCDGAGTTCQCARDPDRR